MKPGYTTTASSLLNVSLRLTPPVWRPHPEPASLEEAVRTSALTVTTYSQSYLSTTGFLGWCEAQLSLSLICNDFCTSFALRDVFQCASGGAFQTRSNHSRTKPQDEGERENRNLLLVKSAFVMYNNLGWTTLRLSGRTRC